MRRSAIEWTDATWNPVAGCSRVSPGCQNCYAIRMAVRLQAMRHPKYLSLTSHSADGATWTGKVTCDDNSLDAPLKWRKPRHIFVNSMSDLFHPGVPASFIHRVWDTMAAAPQHIFQVLTKRPKRMRAMSQHLMSLPNVWLGTTVESATYTWRIRELQATRAALRFLSFEPLLGPLRGLNMDGVDWAIVGGESGPGAREMRPNWVRKIREECREQSVAFFFKQWGGTQKGKTGRELDGQTWDERPESTYALP